MLRALLAAHDDLPEDLRRFDELARAGAAAPSFEEYSARLGEALSPWRETCYFDVASDPALVDVANERFEVLAEALGFAIPAGFLEVLRAGGVAGPEVLQIVLGIDAAAERVRLKYYLIFRDRSGATVERLRAALELPELPASLEPDSVYILGVDFERGGLSDFKLYVRLDSRRVPAVIRNLGHFEALWRGSRYLVFQHCLLGGGRQVYFHLSSAEVLEQWLGNWAARDVDIAGFARKVAVMNEQLRGEGHPILRPWIASFPYRGGGLAPAPSNVYFHFSELG
jgi:hypothetical protein